MGLKLRTPAWYALCASAIGVTLVGCAAAPESLEARYEATVLARARFENGDFRRAAAILSELADESRDPIVWTNLGLVCARRGDAKAAEAAWKTALQLDAQNARAHYELGVEQRTRARQLLEEVRVKDSEKKRAEAAKLFELAVQSLEFAAGSEPSSPAMRAALASAYEDAGRPEPARKAQAEVAHLDPAGVMTEAETRALADIELPPRPRSASAGAISLGFHAEDVGIRATGAVASGADAVGGSGVWLAGSSTFLRAESKEGATVWVPQANACTGSVRFALTMLADRDDRPDVILCTATASPGPMQLWLVRAAASTPELIADLPFEVRALHAADTNRDGHIDLVAAVDVLPGLRIWCNDGDGHFDCTRTVPGLENTPPLRDAACGDFSGDQRPDVIGIDGFGRMRVLVQAQDGSYTDVSRVANLGLERARVVDAADVDGDGKLDLLIGNDAGWWVLANRGNARFARSAAYRCVQTEYVHEKPAQTPVLAIQRLDFDNDGFEDVLTVHPAHPITPAPALAAVAPAAKAGATPPATEDAAPEVPAITAPGPATLMLWRNSGRGVFLAVDAGFDTAAEVLSSSIGIGDFDGDGDLDVACARADSTVLVHWNQGGNTNRRLQVQLVAGRGLHDAYGAMLEIHRGTMVQSQQIDTIPVWVGTAALDRFDVVRIVWPDGRVENRLDMRLPANGPLQITRAVAGG